MNTEDRAMTVLARANPMPDSQPVDSAGDADAYLATLEQRSSEVTQLDTRRNTKQKRSRGNWLVAAAVLVVVLGLAIFLMTRGQEETPVATAPPVQTTVATETTAAETTDELSPELEEALAVATAFMEARVNHDMAGIEDTSIDGHILGFASGSYDLMDEDFAWHEAVGWTIELHGCDLTNPDLTNTRVECSVTHQNSMSAALGEGPFDGTYVMRVLYAGEERGADAIVATTVSESLESTFPISEFTNGTWRPFVTWLETNHSDDAATMFGADASDMDFWLSSGEQKPLLTQPSIDLWRQYVAEFVAEQSG